MSIQRIDCIMIVCCYKEGFSYDELKKENLPKELKGKTKSELKARVNKQRMERNRIQSEIAKYNKRDENLFHKQNLKHQTD